LGDFDIKLSWNPLFGYKAIINNEGSNSFGGILSSWYDINGTIGNHSYLNSSLNAYGSKIVFSGLGPDYTKVKITPILNSGAECPSIEKSIGFNKDDFNLIKNPSFEIDSGINFFSDYIYDDYVANNLIPDGWRPSSNISTRMDLDSYDELYSLKLENMGISTLYTGQDVEVEYGKQYQIYGQVKVDSTCQSNTCAGSIGVHCLRENRSFIWGCPPGIDYNWNFTNDVNWAEIKYNTTIIDPDVKYLVVLCYKTNITAGAVFCDDFNMFKIE